MAQRKNATADEVENPHRRAPFTAKHNLAFRAQSIDPFRQCALAHCHLPQRALRALGTAVLVAACGSIVFDATGAVFKFQFL